MSEDEIYERRFWIKALPIPFHECWEWSANSYSNGYGQFQLNGKPHLAHRIAYELVNGPIPKGLVVRHKCDNPSCIKPEHLELGTQFDNIRDMVKRGRHTNSVKTECKSGHPFDSLNTYVTSSGKRQCKACRKIREAKYRG